MVVPPAIVASIVIAIVAIILMFISLGITIATARAKPGARSTQLLAGGTLIGFQIVILIILVVLVRFYISRRLQGQSAKGLQITMIIFVVLYFLMTIIAVILIFVGANQLEQDDPSDTDSPRNLRAAAALGIISALLYAVSVIIIVAFVASKIPKQYRKTVIKGALASDNDQLFNVAADGAFEQLQRRR